MVRLLVRRITVMARPLMMFDEPNGRVQFALPNRRKP